MTLLVRANTTENVVNNGITDSDSKSLNKRDIAS